MGLKDKSFAMPDENPLPLWQRLLLQGYSWHGSVAEQMGKQLRKETSVLRNQIC